VVVEGLACMTGPETGEVLMIDHRARAVRIAPAR
jgi:hypothetical protein